jgi:exodeoxyribonuclease VII large subunit
VQRPDAYTISSLTEYISALFDADLRMQNVWVQGEISNFTRARSGHLYFTLKDDNAELQCVMWRGSAARLHYDPKHGDSVLAQGAVSVYQPRGQYQLITKTLQPAGRGDLHARFEALKDKLEAEGLFDAERKRPLPVFPHRIGVVTSPTAAAFQDVRNVLSRRFPLAEVILSPTLVQGDSAPPQIVEALARINQANVDVILLVRGGGSLEDLWAFNDEAVARAAAASETPIISGVGHEIDFTIVDFVSDHRAPTPSAAAEVATPNMDDLIYTVQAYRDRLQGGIAFQLDERRRMVETEARYLRGLSPLRRIGDTRQRLDELTTRSVRALERTIHLNRERLTARQKALTAADPRAIMARGYAIVESAGGTRLKRAVDADPGAGIDVYFAQGHLRATVDETHEE